jgi:hypothetical protein
MGSPQHVVSHRSWPRQPGGQQRRRRLGQHRSPARSGIATGHPASTRQRRRLPVRGRGEGLRRRATTSRRRKPATWIPSSITAWRRRSRRCRTAGLTTGDELAESGRAHRRASSAPASAACR